MLEWLFLVGLVGCILAIREDVKRQVGEEEKQLATEIENLENKLEAQRDSVRHSIEIAKKRLDFESCKNAYNNSVKASKTAREILKRSNKISKILDAGLKRINNQLVTSFNERKKLPPYSAERDIKHGEVESGKKLQASINKDINIIRSKRKSISSQIKKLDNETHNLKIQIRDNFGRGGEIFYNRIQESRYNERHK